jgi:hypothetical protein
MKEKIGIEGRLKVDLYNSGVLVQEGNWIENVITTAGKTFLATLLNSANAGTTLVTHMAFGTGVTAVDASDTALTTELSGSGYARVSVTRSNPSGNVIQYTATLTGIEAETTVQEAGLMSASSSGTLFAHQLTGAVTLSTITDSLQVTWQVTFP